MKRVLHFQKMLPTPLRERREGEWRIEAITLLSLNITMIHIQQNKTWKLSKSEDLCMSREGIGQK